MSRPSSATTRVGSRRSNTSTSTLPTIASFNDDPKHGAIGYNLSPRQSEVLKRFREDLEKSGLIDPNDNIATDDYLLLRFLRARKFDHDKSKVMFANAVKWRKDCVNGKSLDQLYVEIDPFDYPNRQNVFKYWPLWFHKTDKYGRPLNIQTLGSFDVKALYKIVDPDFHWKTIMVNCEALSREVLPACSIEKGDHVDSVYCIVDGFAISKFWQIRTLAQKCFQISQDYYPETMGQLSIINAPSSFSYIWRAIKPWLAKETQRKIEILGADYRKELLEHIPAENLPKRFGGDCSCPEGCELSSRGPWQVGRKERMEACRNGTDKGEVREYEGHRGLYPLDKASDRSHQAHGPDLTVAGPARAPSHASEVRSGGPSHPHMGPNALNTVDENGGGDDDEAQGYRVGDMTNGKDH